MKTEDLIVIGMKGKEKTPDPPKEEPDTLQSKATAELVDLLCEGEIEGPANDDNWYKSTYFNEIPLMQSDGTLNFDGVTIAGRTGTSNQEYLRGFDDIQNEVNVGLEVKKATGAIIKIISDVEVDDIKVILSVSGLLQQTDTGDIVGTTVNYRISVTPDGGNELILIASSITGKTTSVYQKQHTIQNLTGYGPAPWTIKVYKDTNDSSSIKLSNKLFWASYTEVKNVKIRYMDRVVIGTTLDTQYFGGDVPFRAWKIKGMKIKVPSNYDPPTRIYSGLWDGTFKTAYSNNPAWVVYDVLNNKRYGLGLEADQIDKWSLYTIGQYCDADVEFVVKTRNPDGGYDSNIETEPRFTFNGVVQSRAEALAIVNHLCSVFRGFPIWSTGQVGFVQDAPKSITKVASPANVIDGIFEYESSPRSMRHTRAKVSYNNPDNFGKLETINIDDDQGIIKYGIQPIDITAFGCNSLNEARRRGTYILYSDINQTELIKFKGGIEWSTALPGEIVAVQDPNYSNKFLSGRVIDSTTNQIVIDRDVEIEDGITYTLLVQQTSGEVAERELNNIAGTWNVLSFDTALSEPVQQDNVWVISTSEVATREFIITRVGEVEKTIYEVNGILYDENKYTLIEDGIVIEPPVAAIQGELDPPSSIDLQSYSYVDGDQDIRKYGIVISWVASTDPRTDDYEIRYKFGDSSGWVSLDTTGQLSYDWRDVNAGEYDISVRARGVTGNSVWVTFADFILVAKVEGPEPPTNLQVLGGGSTFNGPDCEIEWDGSDGTSYSEGYIPSASVGNSNVKGYKVEVYKTDDTLLRTAFTTSREDEKYTYTLAMNTEDNSGVPIRQIKFKVYTVDVYDDASATNATLVASNPAPDMSSSEPTVEAKFGFLKVTWPVVSDNDMSFYNVLFGTTNPPTTLYEKVTHPNNISNILDVTTANAYYVQIVPYDDFGVGIASQVPSSVVPLEIPAIDVTQELEESIVITDIDEHSIETLRKLYDHEYFEGGILYDLGTTDKWIEYKYNLTNYIDRIGVWTADANAKVYVAYSVDGTEWNFLKAGSDHNLIVDADNNSRLTYAVDQADAKANYWQLAGGKNVAVWPNNIVANRVRLWIVGSNYQTRIYELIPSRLIISELAALEFLSAISADIGTIIAGNLQSSNFSGTEGMNIDLDAKQIFLHGADSPSLFYDDLTDTLNIKARVTFKAGTGALDWQTQVSGAQKPDDFATDDRDWRAPEDETTIDGGKIYVGSEINLSEGGKATFGDQNVVIDTKGNEGTIIVAVDGGRDVGNYAELSDGNLQFFYWDGANHEVYNGVARIESGLAANGDTVVIPGIWKQQPKITVSPYDVSSYNATFPSQDQKVQISSYNIQPFDAGNGLFRYTFKMQCELKTKADVIQTAWTAHGGSGMIAGGGSSYSKNSKMYEAIWAGTESVILEFTTGNFRGDNYQGTGDNQWDDSYFDTVNYQYTNNNGASWSSSFPVYTNERSRYGNLNSFVITIPAAFGDEVLVRMNSFVNSTSGKDAHPPSWVSGFPNFPSDGFAGFCYIHRVTWTIASSSLESGTGSWIAMGQ